MSAYCFSRSRSLAGIWLAGVVLVASLASTTSAQTDSTTADDLAREVEKQLDRLETQTEELGARSSAESVAGNEELWEEYQKYRDSRGEAHHAAERVEIGGSIVVKADEAIDGDVVAVGGRVDVYGRIGGDVVAIGGDVQLHDGAIVEGDAVSVGGRVVSDGSAIVEGQRVSVDLGIPFTGMAWGLGFPNHERPRLWSFGFSLAWMIAAVIFSVIFYAVSGRRLEVVSRRVDAEPGQSFLIGLLATFGTPFGLLISIILLAVTVIGIFLLPILVIALVLMWAGAFVAVSLAVGRRVANARRSPDALTPAPSPYQHLLLGILVLYAPALVASILGIDGSFLRPFSVVFGVLGKFVLIFATVLGYGAILTSRFGTSVGGEPPVPSYMSSGGPGTLPPPPPLPSPPPPPPPPATGPRRDPPEATQGGA
jgi:hypothetical protein